jgi:hypothetical protein
LRLTGNLAGLSGLLRGALFDHSAWHLAASSVKRGHVLKSGELRHERGVFANQKGKRMAQKRRLFGIVGDAMLGMYYARGDVDGIVQWLSDEFPERIRLESLEWFLATLSQRRCIRMANRIVSDARLQGDRYTDLRIAAREWLMVAHDEIHERGADQ